jgi:hypothetical protein
LVRCLAGIYWRLRRFPVFEAAIFAARHAQVTQQIKEEDERLRDLGGDGEESDAEAPAETSDAKRLIEIGRTLIKDGIWNDALGKLASHEAKQLNSLRKVQIMLEEMRERRPAKPVTLRALPISSVN